MRAANKRAHTTLFFQQHRAIAKERWSRLSACVCVRAIKPIAENGIAIKDQFDQSPGKRESESGFCCDSQHTAPIACAPLLLACKCIGAGDACKYATHKAPLSVCCVAAAAAAKSAFRCERRKEAERALHRTHLKCWCCDKIDQMYPSLYRLCCWLELLAYKAASPMTRAFEAGKKEVDNRIRFAQQICLTAALLLLARRGLLTRAVVDWGNRKGRDSNACYCYVETIWQLLMLKRGCRFYYYLLVYFAQCRIFTCRHF